MTTKRKKTVIGRSHAAAVSLIGQGSEKNSRLLLVQGSSARPGEMDDALKLALIAQGVQEELNEYMAGDARWNSCWPPFMAFQAALRQLDYDEDDTSSVEDLCDQLNVIMKQILTAPGNGDGDEYPGQADAGDNTTGIAQGAENVQVKDAAGNAYDIDPKVLLQAAAVKTQPVAQSAQQPEAKEETAEPSNKDLLKLWANSVAVPLKIAQAMDDNGDPIDPFSVENPDDPEMIAKLVKPFDPPKAKLPSAGSFDNAAARDAQPQIQAQPTMETQLPQAETFTAPDGSVYAKQAPAPAPAAPETITAPDGSVWVKQGAQAPNPATMQQPAGDPNTMLAQAAEVIQHQQAQLEALQASQRTTPQWYELARARSGQVSSDGGNGMVAQGKADPWADIFAPLTGR